MYGTVCVECGARIPGVTGYVRCAVCARRAAEAKRDAARAAHTSQGGDRVAQDAALKAPARTGTAGMAPATAEALALRAVELASTMPACAVARILAAHGISPDETDDDRLRDPGVRGRDGRDEMSKVVILYEAAARHFMPEPIDSALVAELNLEGRWVTSVTFDWPVEDTAGVPTILEDIFAATNTYGDKIPDLWAAIQPLLSEHRTHTALSVGDRIAIDGTVWMCDHFGWVKEGTE